MSNSVCPSCQQSESIEHIEIPPIEDRSHTKDRRVKVDFAYLSLMTFERRQEGNDRRALSNSGIEVEHTDVHYRVCLNCACQWQPTTMLENSLGR